MTTQTIDPFGATAAGARIAAYAELSSQGPLVAIALPSGAPAWLITGYAEARTALNDPRLAKAPSPQGQLARKLRPDLAAGLMNHMLQVDGADHARLRRLVGAAFTRGSMEALAPRIEQIAVELAETLGGTDPDAVIDLLADYAYPLPMTVICEMLGVPEAKREAFHQVTTAIMAGAYAGEDAFVAGMETANSLLRELVAGKRAAPGSDLISALVGVRDGEDRLSEDELTSMIMLLVVAGHETTVNLIANGIAVLLELPGEWARLRNDQSLLAGAVEELLRFACPVQVGFPMVALESLELGGVAIAAGQVVVPGVLAANRNGGHTQLPDKLDLGRSPNPHLAFGHGIHHCLGAPLARLEGRIALGALLERFPDLALAVPPAELTYRPNFLFHGLTTLPVRLGKPE